MPPDAPRDRASDVPAPARIGRYDVLLPIASGGMATVYLARSHGLGGFERNVALKLTHQHLRQSGDFARELIEEAKLAANIHHPNVVGVLDIGDDPLGVFLVMEYVEGTTLARLMRHAHSVGESLPPQIGLKLLVDALEGLHAAHELKDAAGDPVALVHRDFSPQNILVGVDGIGRLADFGVAKAATRLGNTRTGLIKGKIAYMSPEQARDETVDRRCDVWAAGVVAWEIVAGRRLYRVKGETAMLLEIVSKPPPRLPSEIRAAHPALDSAIMSALTMGVQKRCPSAAELSRRLARSAAEAFGTIETAEVAEYVRLATGQLLAERRARVATVLELRAKMAEATQVVTEASSNSDQLAQSASASTPDQTRTDTTSVSPQGIHQPKLRTSRKSWFVGGSLAVALGIIALVMLGQAPAPALARKILPALAGFPPVVSPKPAATPLPEVSAAVVQPSGGGEAAPERKINGRRKRDAPAQSGTGKPAWGF